MKVKIPSASPFFDNENTEEILKDIRSTLKSGVLTNGPQTQTFEREFANYVQSKFAIAVNSGSAALEIMLRFFGVEGKEVIVPTNTFVATPNAVIFAGGKPIFSDIDQSTLGIDTIDITNRINTKTTGIIAVHVAGLISPQIKELRDLCREKNLFLIEDAAHAIGAKLNDQMAGNMCDGGAFSFYPTKVMTSGQGGMITTNNSNLANFALKIRDHGLDSNRLMNYMGNNWSMSEITAIIGKHQLRRIEQFVTARNNLAKYYDEHLKKIQNLSTFNVPDNLRHSYYKYPIKLNDNINVIKVARLMRIKYGIETGSIYYPPCHLQPWYINNCGFRIGDFPIAEKVLKQVLCLPMHLRINEITKEIIINSLRLCLENNLN